MSKRRCGVGVAVLNDLLYAVGGHDGQSYLNSIERQLINALYTTVAKQILQCEFVKHQSSQVKSSQTPKAKQEEEKNEINEGNEIISNLQTNNNLLYNPLQQ